MQNNNTNNTSKLTKQEKQEQIKALKKSIKELSSEVNTDKSYSLEDITSGDIFSCPNQLNLNKLFAHQEQLEKLLKGD